MMEFEKKKIEAERLIKAMEWLSDEQAKAYTDMIIGTATLNKMVAMRTTDNEPTPPAKRTA